MSDIVRKLATIREIAEIRPIEGADRIVAYRVDGWWCVGQKDEYNVGDLTVYCEVDSWIPTEIAPFLSKGKEPREYNGVKGERLRTIRLRGQLSQGLLLPVEQPENGGVFVVSRHTHKLAPVLVPVALGDDVTELLGIQKWEAPINAQLAGTVRGNFPSFVPKTDQERIQNCWRNVERVKTERFEVTQKLDGSSMTAYYRRHPEYGADFGICSRNLDLKQDENNAFWKVALRYDLPEKLEAFGLNIAIQGELIGPGIQGNPERLTDLDLFVFDIFDID
jgi:RNA ligase (TIGR02306 family)